MQLTSAACTALAGNLTQQGSTQGSVRSLCTCRLIFDVLRKEAHLQVHLQPAQALAGSLTELKVESGAALL